MVSDPAFVSARVAARYCVGFLLDQIRSAADGRNFLESLIFLTIIQANVAYLDRDPELQRLYSSVETPPPDSLRRPISVSAIANALRIPYETARRRVQQLIVQGDCLMVERGVIVPANALAGPQHVAIVTATFSNVRQLYWAVRDLGVLRDMPTPLADAPKLPIRAIARVTSDYCLRLMDVITTHIGDLTSGVLLLQIMQANTEHLGGGDRRLEAEGLVAPDDLRRPAMVSDLAARLKLPVETTRRHGAILVANGLAERAPGGGLMVCRAHLIAPPWPQLVIDNLAHMNLMFAKLSPLGLLAEWDRVEQPTLEAGGAKSA